MDVFCTGASNKVNEDATKLEWQTTSSSGEGSEEDSSSDDNPFPPILAWLSVHYYGHANRFGSSS
jgi:hypothetical protein